ncbi:hypothetical protein C2845_PM05G04150 [Panicum miliaceum]|uniref:Uncharacterized protein n=1 Tax=Panicum miliaceum TaxID=4540 RepID=A0A3L6T052_PANMI|nr:hypothetical protein C2845_PM05G04150 [Panicum miliaceum]
MRASQTTQGPQPLPLPPPPLCLPSPPAAPRRGRHRSSYSSSSSSSSSVSSASSTFCPSPSPAPSPRARTSSLVPFSWERHPGVPKNSSRGGLASPTGTPLPLPPPLQPPSSRRRRRRPRAKLPAAAPSDANGGDPFVAAFAECTRDDDGEDDEADHGADDAVAAAKDKQLWLAPAKPTVSGRAGRPWRPAAGGFLGFPDLYGCKSAMAVADGAFLARRPAAATRR